MRKFIFTLISLFIFKTAIGETVPSKSKNIVYRGGIAEFSIPATWREEYDQKGGGTFYEDKPDSGTLRLNVLSFDSPDTPADEMVLSAFPQGSFEVLESGLPMKHYTKSIFENGEQLKIYYWEIAIPIQPYSIRLAVFSYAALDHPEAAHNNQTEIAFLDHSVRQAKFSRESGLSGTYQ